MQGNQGSLPRELQIYTVIHLVFSKVYLSLQVESRVSLNYRSKLKQV